MWADYSLCSIADVRQRLTSPEGILGMSTSPSTPVAVTLTGSQFSAVVAHRLLEWSAVQFSTDGSLPSPLQAGVTYYARDITTPFVFSVAQYIGGAALTLTPGTGQTTVIGYAVDGAIASKISMSKDWIYSALLVEVQNRVPMIAWRWQNRKRAQIDYLAQSFKREFELAAKTTLIPIVPGVYDGSILDIYQLLLMARGLIPRTFVTLGVPTNGTNGSFAGEAEAGSVLLDQSDSAKFGMYYNAGTLNSPMWVHPTAAYCLDRLLNVGQGRVQSTVLSSGGSGYARDDVVTITGGSNDALVHVLAVNDSGVATSVETLWPGNNYSVASNIATSGGSGTGLTVNILSQQFNALKDTAVDYAIWAMAQDGMFTNRVFDHKTMDYWGTDAESKFAKRAKERLSQAINLLDIDIDGDGKISDFEAELFHRPSGVFA